MNRTLSSGKNERKKNLGVTGIGMHKRSVDLPLVLGTGQGGRGTKA